MKVKFSETSQWTLNRLGSRRIQKKLLRSIVAFAVTMVLLIDSITAKRIGQAAVFAGALSLVLPPFLPISGHIYIMFMLVFWLLFSWALVCAGTAAAFAVRSTSLLLSQFKSAQASFVPGVSVTVQNRVLISIGHYLDPRSSAVFAIFLFLTSFFFALGLGYRPDMTLVLLFGLTFIDSMYTVNPLIPKPSYLSSQTFLIATLCYAAVSTGSMLIIFPESFNHTWISTIREEILLPLIDYLNPDTDDTTEGSTENAISHLDPIIHFYERQEGTFDLEVSIHRLSPDQLHVLFRHVKQLVVRAKNIGISQKRLKTEFQPEQVDGSTASKSTQKYKLSNLYHKIRHRSDSLRIACQVSALDIEEWFRECAMDSWSDVFRAADTHKIDYRRLRLQISQGNLMKAQSKFKKDELPALIAECRTGIASRKEAREENDSEGDWNDQKVAIALSMMDDHNLLATEIQDFLSYLIDIENCEPKPKLRLPHFLTRRRPKDTKSNEKDDEKGKAPADILSPSLTLLGSDFGMGGETSKQTPKPTKVSSFWNIMSLMRRAIFMDAPAVNTGPQGDATQMRHASTPESKRHPFIRWLSTPETIYSFRVALLSVAIFVPLINQTTTEIFATNFGVIVMILGQSYVAVYAGDQVYFFLIRFAGTLIGVALIPVAWYISAGKGLGNAYAIVILNVILVIPCLFVSVASVNRNVMLFSTLLSTTLVTSTGLIWEALNNFPTGAAPSTLVPKSIWIRIVLDLIGFGASAVVMMIPKPITSRRAFHTKVSESLLHTSTLLRNDWDDASSGDGSALWKDFRVDMLQGITERNFMLKHFLTSMKFDPRIRSIPFPLYRRVFDMKTSLLSSIVNYLEALGRLDPAIRSRVIQETPYANNDLINRIQTRIAELAQAFASTKSLPPKESLTGLQDEMRQAQGELSGPGLYNAVHNMSDDISKTEMMILSSVIMNLKSILEALDEMGTLIPKLEPWRTIQPLIERTETAATAHA